MTKSELILAVSNRFPYLTHSDTALSVQTILDGMADQLSNAQGIEIRGFGSFSVYIRAPRIARNPKTGEKVQIEAKRVLYFKPGLGLKNRVNDNTQLHNVYLVNRVVESVIAVDSL